MVSQSPSERPSKRRMEVDGGTFSTIERLILTHDGTVMRLLETLTQRTVDVDIIARRIRNDVLHRSVTLKFPDDPEPLAWAESQVDLEDLETEYAHTLRERNVGIGKMFRENRFETFRELVDYELVTEHEQLPAFIDADTEVMFRRTYDVYHNDTDVMTITEYFPKGSFEEFLT